MQFSVLKVSVNHTFIVLIVVLTICVSYGCNTESKQAQIERRIVEKANNINEELVEIRRDLHRNPELSGQESRTAKIITERLKSFGLEVRTNVGGHGVLGILRGEKNGPIVAYRADMDALPQDIQEQVAYGSAKPGVSHACGHDVHTAIGLGIAQVLSSLKDELHGTIMFIFQPAEETVEGAMQMIAEGVLSNPIPEAIFAIHVVPIEVGQIVTNPGVGLPGLDNFTIKLKGAENLQDIAEALADSIRALGTVHFPESSEDWIRSVYALFEENSDFSSFILAIAWTEEGSTKKERIVRGFFKASGEEQYNKARALTQKALSYYERQDISCEIKFEKVLPDMFCDKELAEWAIDPLTAILGEQSVLQAYNSLPFFGEDFAYFLQQIPGVMFFLGASNTDKDITALPHSPSFGIDEKAILVGVKGMSNVIVQYQLNHTSDPGSNSR